MAKSCGFKTPFLEMIFINHLTQVSNGLKEHENNNPYFKTLTPGPYYDTI